MTSIYVHKHLTDYFCEVNVLATMHNLIDFCPSFWSSEQLLNSFTKGGEIIQLDPSYFAKVGSLYAPLALH